MKAIVSIIFLFIFSLPTRLFAHGNDHRVGDDGSIFSHYSLIEIINPILLFSLIGVYLLYKKSLERKAAEHNAVVTRKNKLYVGLGLAMIYFSLGGPIAILANNMSFTAHMVQQSFMYIVMPPLILLGVPSWFLKAPVQKLMKNPVFNLFRNPLIAIFLFNFLWSIYHLPVIFEYLLTTHLLMMLGHLTVTIAAFFMWIQVIPPVKELSRLSDLQRIAYMYANGLLITPACALIIFSDQLLYPSLVEAPAVYSAMLSPLFDQRTGGVVMKIVQEFSYGTIIGYIFFRWVKREKKEELQEGLVAPNLSYIQTYEQK